MTIRDALGGGVWGLRSPFEGLFENELPHFSPINAKISRDYLKIERCLMLKRSKKFGIPNPRFYDDFLGPTIASKPNFFEFGNHKFEF